MWYMNMKNKTPDKNSSQKHIEDSAYETREKKDIITLFSQAMWNPVPTTWIKSKKAMIFATWKLLK